MLFLSSAQYLATVALELALPLGFALLARQPLRLLAPPVYLKVAALLGILPP